MWSGCAGLGHQRREPSPLFALSHRGLKLKRSRQRVDAGQPRNSYPPHRQPFSSASPPMSSTTPFATSPATNAAPHFDPSAHAAAPFASLFNSSHMNAFYRLQQQALLSAAAASDEAAAKAPPSSAIVSEPATGDSAAPGSPPIAAAAQSAESNGNDAKACDTCDETEVDEDVVAAKRSRVENIVNSIHSAPNSPSANADTSGSAEAKSEVDEPRSLSAAGSTGCETSPRSKRKSYQPQKELNGSADSDLLGDATEAEVEKKEEQPPMDRFQMVLEHQRRQYLEWLNSQQQKAKESSAAESGTARPEADSAAVAAAAEDLRQRIKAGGSGTKELSNLAATLKTELSTQLASTVDRILGDFMEKESARMQAQMRALEANRSQQAAAARAASATANPYGNLFNQYYGAFGAYGAAAFPNFSASSAAAHANASIFPGSFNSAAAAMGSPFSNTPEATSVRRDPFNYFNNKRKRSKVTDTRISGRLSGLKEEGRGGSPNGYYPPTMVGHPLYGASLPGLDDLRDNDSPAFSDDLSFESGPVDPNIPQSTTLTPMHLRKAKLMFFFTRYPSSTLIKTYFPDIRFNKNTTAQLVKWFSNFREFYYIQMEKFARQALAEGIRRPEDIHITVDGDLYKTLNQHYNRNNHIQPPTDFRDVVEATLREFFLSVQAGKDTESSWKKQIYKVIARLDSTIPDYFKNPHFLDQLD